jgi:UDP-sugar transporter A1/2/3
VCAAVLLRSLTPKDVIGDVSREFWPLGIPAGLFALQNNLLFVALTNLEATLFQVTYQMKLLFTAMLMVLMLNRRLSGKKWTSLFVLFIGIVLTQLDAAKNKDPSAESSLAAGLTAVVVCALSSGLASVYFEKVLKTSTASLFTRNVQLSLFSIVINFALYILQNDISRLLVGFNWLTWVLVANQAVGGLLVAMVMKYADNILKGFATSAAIVVSGIISASFFGFEPSLQFASGAALVLAATYLYSASD